MAHSRRSFLVPLLIYLPIRWAIFSGGRIRSQIRAEEARTEQALAAYE